MKKPFDLLSYQALLKREEEEKKKIKNSPFLDENFLEILNYTGSVTVEICYNHKEDYFLVIEEYLNHVISPYQFRSKLLQMEKEDSQKSNIILEDFQKLKDFTITEGLDKFSNLMDEIFTLCSEFDETWDGTIEPMSESKFYDLVNNYYFQLQNKNIFSD